MKMIKLKLTSSSKVDSVNVRIRDGQGWIFQGVRGFEPQDRWLTPRPPKVRQTNWMVVNVTTDRGNLLG